MAISFSGCRLIDPEKEVVYIPMVPNVVEGQLNTDPVTYANSNFEKAKYLNIEICDDYWVCVPLPFTNPNNHEVATYIRDRYYITITNHSKAAAFASKVRIQYVLQ